jgi:hypothetical protein
VFNPSTQKLSVFESQIFYQIGDFVLFEDNSKIFFALLVLEPIYEAIDSHQQIMKGYSQKTLLPQEFSFEFIDLGYKYERPILSIDTHQYNVYMSDLFLVTKRPNSEFSNLLYIPKEPYSNYRIIKGYGDIPDELKGSSFEADELTDICLCIGSPVFISTNQSFANNGIIRMGAISPPSSLVYGERIGISNVGSFLILN